MRNKTTLVPLVETNSGLTVLVNPANVTVVRPVADDKFMLFFGSDHTAMVNAPSLDHLQQSLEDRMVG